MSHKTFIATLIAVMGMSQMQAADQASLTSRPIYGSMLSSDSWDMETEGPQYGIYSFDGTAFEPIVTDPYLAAMGGGTYVNGVYCYNYNFSFMGELAQNLYLLYDFERDEISGWQLFETQYSDIATQVAYDETSGKVYGQFYNRDRSGRVWGTRDLEMGETSPLRPMLSNDLCALAFDNLGRAWAVDMAGDLLQIDKLTGTTTLVGKTGLNLAPTLQQSGAIDPITGEFYFFAALADNTSVLYTIDLTTAMATQVAALPNNEQITGAYFLPKTYQAAAPGAPQMKLNFDKSSLSGTVSCVAPAVTEAGSVLTAGALLTLTVDGVKVAETQTTPGQAVSFDVTVEKMGVHIFQIIASNEQGEGRPATEHQWIGLDIPVEVSNLAAHSIDNSHALLSWAAPTEGLHGGYIDPAHLRYMIIDSEGSLVASDLSETSYEVSKSGSRLTARTYTVTAFTDSEAGLSATSNRVYFGSRYKVPYTTYFDTDAEYDLWTVLDANDDGHTWSYDSYNRYVKYTYHKYNDADDWLFSAPIRLNAEQYYDLTSNMSVRMSYYSERFEIFVCSAQHPDSVVAVVRNVTTTEKDGKEERRFYTFNDNFCVPVAGDYFLAYHCVSYADQLDLELRSIDLTLGASFDAPAAADNAVFHFGSMGSMSASVEFDAPTKSIRGNELTSLTKAELYNGDYLCATLTDIQPGLHYTLVDGKATKGYNDYRLVICNEYGKGLPVDGRVYVGPDTPASPENVHISLVGNDVTLSWDPVTIGEHGGYVDPLKITYAVVRQNDVELVYSGEETSCVDNTLPNTGAQSNWYYGVFAYFGTTNSEGVATKDVILGTPYSMPFEETFAEDSGTSTLWIIGYDLVNPYSTIGTKWDIGEYPSYDGKPGNLTCTAYYDEGGYHFLHSGKIRVNSNATLPVLTFPYMCASLDDKIKVVISTEGVPDQGDVVAICQGKTTSDWNQAIVDLTPYKGKNIIVTWHCYMAGKGDIVLDDICVKDNPEAGIEQVVMEGFATAPAYDLQGRRVQPGKSQGFEVSRQSKRLILNTK